MKIQSILWASACVVSMNPVAYAQKTDVSVLIVYTDDTRAAVGGTSNVETDIIAAISDGNLALDNTDVLINLSIASMQEIELDESQYLGMPQLLDDLTNPNHAVFGVVHEWRDLHGADLVYLMFEGIQQNGQANAVCGSLDPCDETFESLAFAVGQRGLMEVAPIVIHELGHLMGLRHDRGRDCGNPDDTCISTLFPYSFGYIDPVGPSWGTIMAGGRPFPLLDFFSSPIHFHPDTNQVLGEENFTDAAQALTNVREIISNFREPPPDPVYDTSIYAAVADTDDQGRLKLHLTVDQSRGVGAMGTCQGTLEDCLSRAAGVTMTPFNYRQNFEQKHLFRSNAEWIDPRLGQTIVLLTSLSRGGPPIGYKVVELQAR